MDIKKFLLIPLLFLVTGCSTVAVSSSFDDKVNLTDDGSVPVQGHNLIKLHTGELFAATTSVNVGAGSTVYLKANSTQPIHLLQRSLFATTTGVSLDYTILLYEGGTDTGATNEVGEFNVNRAIPLDDSTMDIYKTVSGVNLTSAVNLPFNNRQVSDKKFSTSVISETEYVLNNDTNYYLSITNNDGGVLTVSFNWVWYEGE